MATSGALVFASAFFAPIQAQPQKHAFCSRANKNGGGMLRYTVARSLGAGVLILVLPYIPPKLQKNLTKNVTRERQNATLPV
jgi:hypothetical protein